MEATLRADLRACMTADPEGVLTLLQECIEECPALAAVLARRVPARLRTLLVANDAPALPAATPELLAAVRGRATLVVATVAVPHPPLLLGGRAVELRVAPGTEAIVLGGHLVALAGAAAGWGALVQEGRTPDQAWDLLSSAICSQFAGPLARRSLTRAAGAPGAATGRSAARTAAGAPEEPDARHAPAPPAPPPLVAEPEQPARACLHVIAADWPGAGRLRRQRQETDRRYLGRVLAALQAADRAGDAAAAVALAQVRTRYPAYAATLDPTRPG